MKNIIIGTAGHIDHGKTTLIRALTGRNTDTLKEEIKRGISINLGFTYFTLPSGKTAGIVDVPGHERFIKNMIAGASGIDIVLLTIAATEGVKPQTLEHADILGYLGIKDGIIVITKSDLADDIMKELVADDIREGMKGTFFEGKEMIFVDSVSGFGLDTLAAKIDEMAEEVAQRNIALPPRLNIDRVFTAKGFGTIVTGTLMEGKISLDDQLFLYHCDVDEVTKTKIKNIQVHEKNVPVAYAGQRTALNLAFVKASALTRGDVLAQEGSVIKTNLADVKFTLSNHIKTGLKMWDRLRIYTGAREIFARFVPLGALPNDLINPGESGFGQLRFEKEIYIKKDDPFVIRRYSPMQTLGGGTVLDPNPVKRRRADIDDLNALSVKLEGSHEDVVETFLKNAKESNMTVKALSALISVSEDETKNALDRLVEERVVICLSRLYFHINVIEDFRMRLMEIVAGFHNKFKLKQGISKEELRSRARLPVKPKEFDTLLAYFCDDNTLKLSKGIVSLATFFLQYSPEQQNIRRDIEQAYLNAKFTPPPKSQFSADKKVLEVFESMIPEILIGLDEQNYLHTHTMYQAKEMIKGHILAHKSLTLAEFRDMTDSSRKYCLLILEYLDNNRFTKRDGEIRILY